VFPTVVEGAARVVQKAMACGVPVINTPNAGVIIRDGIDGFLVTIQDVEALSERLLELYNHPERRAAKGREGRRSAAENFAPERYREGLIKLHDPLLGER
jgi:starch synthase